MCWSGYGGWCWMEFWVKSEVNCEANIVKYPRSSYFSPQIRIHVHLVVRIRIKMGNHCILWCSCLPPDKWNKTDHREEGKNMNKIQKKINSNGKMWSSGQNFMSKMSFQTSKTVRFSISWFYDYLQAQFISPIKASLVHLYRITWSILLCSVSKDKVGSQTIHFKRYFNWFVSFYLWLQKDISTNNLHCWLKNLSFIFTPIHCWSVFPNKGPQSSPSGCLFTHIKHVSTNNLSCWPKNCGWVLHQLAYHKSIKISQGLFVCQRMPDVSIDAPISSCTADTVPGQNITSDFRLNKYQQLLWHFPPMRCVFYILKMHYGIVQGQKTFLWDMV